MASADATGSDEDLDDLDYNTCARACRALKDSPTHQSFATRTYWFFRDRRTAASQTLAAGADPLSGGGRLMFPARTRLLCGGSVRIRPFTPQTVEPDIAPQWRPRNIVFRLLASAIDYCNLKQAALSRGGATTREDKERTQWTQFSVCDTQDCGNAISSNFMVLRAKSGGATAEQLQLQLEVPICECVPLGDGDGYFRGEACRRYDEWLLSQNTTPTEPIGRPYDTKVKTPSMWHDFLYGCMRCYKRKYKNATTALREILGEDKKIAGSYACYVKSQDPRGLQCWQCKFTKNACECYLNKSGEEIKAGACTREYSPTSESSLTAETARDPLLAELIKYETDMWGKLGTARKDTTEQIYPVSISKLNTDVYNRKGVGVTGIKGPDGNVGVPYVSLNNNIRSCNNDNSCLSCSHALEERAEIIEIPPQPCTCESCPTKTPTNNECAWNNSGKGITCIPCRYKETCDCYVDKDGIERSAGTCKFMIKRRIKKPNELQNLKMEIMQFLKCSLRRLKCHRHHKEDDIDVKEEYVHDWARPMQSCGFRYSEEYNNQKGQNLVPLRLCTVCQPNINRKICDCKAKRIGVHCKAVTHANNLRNKIVDATNTERQQYPEDDPLSKGPCRWRTFIEKQDRTKLWPCELYDGSGTCATCRDVVKLKDPKIRNVYSPPCRWKIINKNSEANENESVEANENESVEASENENSKSSEIENSKACKICDFRRKYEENTKKTDKKNKKKTDKKKTKKTDKKSSKRDDGKSQKYTTLRLCCNKLKPESKMLLNSKSESKSRTDATLYGEYSLYDYENTTSVIEFIPSKSNETHCVDDNAVINPDNTNLEVANTVNSDTKFGENYNVMMYFRNRTKSPYDLNNYSKSKTIECNMKYRFESKNVAEVESESKSDLEAGAKVAIEAQAEKSGTEDKTNLYDYKNTTSVIEFIPSKSNETHSVDDSAVIDPDNTKLEVANTVNSDTKFGVMMYFRNRTKSPYDLNNYSKSKTIECNMKYRFESKNVAEVESESKSDLKAGAKVAVEAQAEKSETEDKTNLSAQLRPSAGFHILRTYTMTLTSISSGTI